MAKRTRIYFTSDVHGSDRCFLKFLNAARVYEADVLVIGGDLTGKVMIPVIQTATGTHEADVFGRRESAQGDSALQDLLKLIRMNGQYPYLTSEDEYLALSQDPQRQGNLFREVMRREFDRWLGIAEQRLAGSGVQCYILPGNDDELDIDGVFAAHPGVTNPEGRVLDLDARTQMIATGYVNTTPWDAPRDVSEEALGERIAAMASSLKDPERTVCVFHAPPKDTPLDQCPVIDEDFRQKTAGGQVVMGPAGSQAVRETIERLQPTLTLHGHIHESRGAFRMGRTLCINPGSEYAEGVLHGALVDLVDGRVKAYKLLAG